ncbi:MAG: hypothetical protein J0M07_00475 [Anaerolineae bacterium]|nr:hypothetical protein [Anaerolineae bacterium]
MPKETLPPDPKATEIWQNLPQSPPTKEVLPPLLGGGNVFRTWWFWLFVAFGVVALLSLIAGRA